jgi:hypothetical protein
VVLGTAIVLLVIAFPQGIAGFARNKLNASRNIPSPRSRGEG